jgi:hypothetical protein
MESLIVIIAIFALLVALDVLALRFGTESRDGFTEAQPRSPSWR